MSRTAPWEDIVVNESTYLNLVDYRIQLTAHLNDVNGQISRMPSRTAQDKMNLQQCANSIGTALIKSWAASIPRSCAAVEVRQPGRADRVVNEFKKNLDQFLKEAAEAGPMFREVKQKYEELAADGSVQNALKRITWRPRPASSSARPRRC